MWYNLIAFNIFTDVFVFLEVNTWFFSLAYFCMLISSSDNVKFILIQSDSSDSPSISSALWNLSRFLICSNKDWLYFIPDVYFFSWDLSLPSLLPGESLYCSWVGALISYILFLLPYWFIIIFGGASSNFFVGDPYGIHFVIFFYVWK